jgi:hypothetical protein
MSEGAKTNRERAEELSGAHAESCATFKCSVPPPHLGAACRHDVPCDCGRVAAIEKALDDKDAEIRRVSRSAGLDEAAEDGYAAGMEAAARIAEEHQDHMDIADHPIQNHRPEPGDPPRCCVADAIRAGKPKP